MEKSKKTLAQLGTYGLMDHIKNKYISSCSNILAGLDEDAVIEDGDPLKVSSNTLLLEGIHFDLIYTPLQHLGYKAVTATITDILAMNATPLNISISLGIGNKTTLEMTEELMAGISMACKDYNIELAGFTPSSSLTGLTLSLTANGKVSDNDIALRSGASTTDIICITGNLGASLMGLHLLEREKRVLKSKQELKPELEGHEYVLKRQLKPEARLGINSILKEININPSSMIAIKEGVAAALLLLCKASGTGCRIYENKLPIDQNTLKAAKELKFNPLIAALNGGEDYELLFTIPLEEYEKNKDIIPDEITVAGFIADKDKGCRLITSSDQETDLTSPGWGQNNR
ncbi:thiamine-phosphate kinase [Marinilabiliaceae bacterium ANBcel2]|nr:thiamine-phosphate kinase [Marinilabiliaceae bacterium ANBcel2]